MTAPLHLPPTPGQTVGPFFAFGLEYDDGPFLVPVDHPDSVRLHGKVLDGAGDPVPDALVEIWQADPTGHVPQVPGSLRRDPGTFTGFGRSATDPHGRWAFTTLVPGPVAPDRPAFFALTIFARGLMHRLHTRAYLPDRAGDRSLGADPLLSALSPQQRKTLMVRPDGRDLLFDVHLQGDAETVFLQHTGHRD